MYLVTHDGHVKVVEHTGLECLQEAVGGYIAAVGTLPLNSGYSCYVNDEGLLEQLPENLVLEGLMKYAPLVGNGVIVSFQEAGETDLLPDVKPERFDHVTKRLEAMVAKSEAEDGLMVDGGPVAMIDVIASKPLWE